MGQSGSLIKFTKPKGCQSMSEKKSKVHTFPKKFRIRRKASLCWGWRGELVNELLLEDNQIQKEKKKMKTYVPFYFTWWNYKIFFFAWSKDILQNVLSPPLLFPLNSSWAIGKLVNLWHQMKCRCFLEGETIIKLPPSF